MEEIKKLSVSDVKVVAKHSRSIRKLGKKGLVDQYKQLMSELKFAYYNKHLQN